MFLTGYCSCEDETFINMGDNVVTYLAKNKDEEKEDKDVRQES